MTSGNHAKNKSGHKHKWTALWSHWGPYGSQNEHYHECFVGSCKHMLVGLGRECDGKFSTHEVTLGVNKRRTALSEV